MPDRLKVALIAPLVLVVVVLAYLAVRPAAAPASAPGNVLPSNSPTATVARLPVVFDGDSITAADSPGFDARPGAGSWARYVTEDDNSPWSVQANVAVGGQSTPQILARFDKDVIARNPKAVVLLAGTNDFGKISQAKTLDNLAAMVTASTKAGAKVYLLTLCPRADFAADVRSMNAGILKRFQGQADVRLIDTYPALAGPDGGWPKNQTDDGIHPNIAGAQAIAAAVLAQL